MMDRSEAARKLVEAWAASDNSITSVYVFHLAAASDDEPTGFLIVSGTSPPADRAHAFGFRATKDVPFPTRIAEVPADHFGARVEEGGFLPAGWRMDEAEQLWPPQ